MHIRLDPTSGTPFYRQVEAALADAIREGRVAPGALLPSVRALAQDVLVSVITIKQAYEALEAQGLVYSRQGRGTFVAENGAAAARDRSVAALASSVRASVDQARRDGLSAAQIRATVLAALPEEP
jgi:GntR family transcriptional regulator